MKLYEARYEGGVLAFNSWRFLKISGEDSDAYIQNHVTNDLTSCKLNFAQLNARLDRGGKIQSYFYVGKKDSYYLVIVPEDMAEVTLCDLIPGLKPEDVLPDTDENPINSDPKVNTVCGEARMFTLD